MTIREGLGAADGVVSIREGQRLEHGGQGEGDGIEGTWKPRAVRLVFSVPSP